jgi:endonuclease/exonuclease/phosphatase family metal-dependent hydrolase
MYRRISTILILLLTLSIAACQGVESSTSLDTTTLSVMSFNVGDSDFSFPKAQEVSLVVRKSGKPDILLMQEARGEKQIGVIARELGYPYHAEIPYKSLDNSFLAILSIFPVNDVQYLYFKSSLKESGVICGVINPYGQPILACSVHLDEIKSKRRLKNGYVDQSFKHSLSQIWEEIFGDTVRSKSVDELIPWVASQGRSNIIIGADFNTIPLSKPIRTMGRAFNDALWPSVEYLSGTYFKIKSPLLPRVDYIFHSATIKTYHPRVIKQSPGDHYPVRAEFSCRKEQ